MSTTGKKRPTVKQLQVVVRRLWIACICLFVICASLLAVVIKNRSNIKLFGPDKKSSNTVEDVPAVTADSSDYVVCLDPGHGGRFTGTQGLDGTYEKDDTLKIALEVKKALENRGVKVVMTRTDDSDIELDERAAIANDANADLFLSLHRNYTAGDKSAKGFEVWIHSTNSDTSRAIASAILEGLDKVGISEDRGVKVGTQGDSEHNYAVIRDTNMTSVIAELGFMSNQEDLDLFNEHHQEYAIAIAEAVVDWLNTYCKK
ncbi:n-acetylmuramoyl-L-alanine amidase [Coprococcus sp. CAG:782]|nr:n-acetylmuramoyl-L-alanine amidase [Coprococcus sp. CAG:782]